MLTQFGAEVKLRTEPIKSIYLNSQKCLPPQVIQSQLLEVRKKFLLFFSHQRSWFRWIQNNCNFSWNIPPRILSLFFHIKRPDHYSWIRKRMKMMTKRTRLMMMMIHHMHNETCSNCNGNFFRGWWGKWHQVTSRNCEITQETKKINFLSDFSLIGKKKKIFSPFQSKKDFKKVLRALKNQHLDSSLMFLQTS